MTSTRSVAHDLVAIAITVLALTTAPRPLLAQAAVTADTSSSAARAARVARPPAPRVLPADLVSFFTGRWSCAGEFSNGRKIASDVEFAPALDSSWMQFRHTDRPPNSYTALGMWGVSAGDSDIVALLFSKEGSVRRLVASPWDGTAITFVADTTFGPVRWLHRFTYRKQSASQFRMSYEVWRDAAWRLGDYIICDRR